MTQLGDRAGGTPALRTASVPLASGKTGQAGRLRYGPLPSLYSPGPRVILWYKIGVVARALCQDAAVNPQMGN